MTEYELIAMILEGKAPPPQFKKKDEKPKAEEKHAPPGAPGDDQSEPDQEDQGQEDQRDDDDEDDDGEPLVDGSSKSKIDLKPKMKDETESKSQVAEDRLDRVLRRIARLQ